MKTPVQKNPQFNYERKKKKEKIRKHGTVGE